MLLGVPTSSHSPGLVVDKVLFTARPGAAVRGDAIRCSSNEHVCGMDIVWERRDGPKTKSNSLTSTGSARNG